MSISIVIPCYNHADLLPIAWKSVEAQTMPNFQVILVNDASTDRTQEAINSIKPRPGIDLVTLTNHKNLGQSETLNRAIQQTNAEYVMVLNDDDYLMHDALEAAMFVINKAGKPLFGAACKPFNGSWLNDYTGPRMIKDTIAYDSIELQIKNPSDIDPCNHQSVAMTHSGMTVKRSAWSKAGGYKQPRKRNVYWSDRDFQLSVAKIFGCIMATGTPFSFWRQDRSVDEGRFT